jgi:repressor LexA
MEDLTARQAEIFEFIKDHIEETGFPPTRAEIADTFGFRSVNAAEDHLKALERKGVLEILPGTSRGLRLLIEKGIPVVGKVAAGTELLDSGNIESYLEIDTRIFKPRATFAVKMPDMSLAFAGIFAKDVLVMAPAKQAKNDQIVAAIVGGKKLVVRRLKRKSKNIVELVPDSDEFDTITVNTKEEECSIEGIAVGVLRNGKL